MSNDLSSSGSRWEPFSSPRPVLAHPDGPITPDDHSENRAPHPVYDITSTATHAVAGPSGRKGVRRTVVLVAAAAGLVLAGGAGGYAIGHATGGTPAAGIDGGTSGLGGFGGERHRLGGQAPGDGQGLGTPGDGALPQGGTGTGGTGTGAGTGSGSGSSTGTTGTTTGLSA
ncbi:hypothetical protein GCM10010472_58830 [Pseudonocardia halophobica]|uniref:Uncharacterized protein n=1 Tax=Pseudonocardia halophobica TaxID=29401 RepID=A0A9W6UF32_9PSEU|nr:hypothetical protein [Pseudonocardia halophobica]GLL15279.1 hypothetical protein GCM10017577_64290 [Pseudonocardia halophobica]